MHQKFSVELRKWPFRNVAVMFSRWRGLGIFSGEGAAPRWEFQQKEWALNEPLKFTSETLARRGNVVGQQGFAVRSTRRSSRLVWFFCVNKKHVRSEVDLSMSFEFTRSAVISLHMRYNLQSVRYFFQYLKMREKRKESEGSSVRLSITY